MNRIQPTHFIEVFHYGNHTSNINSRLEKICSLEQRLSGTRIFKSLYTTAIFLIQPSDLSIEERMERRMKNDSCIDPFFNILGCDMPKGSCKSCSHSL